MFSKLNLKVKPAIALFALTAALGVFSAPATAAVLDVRGGVLFGASGVEVGGSFYNVEFVDGTFDSVFGSTPLIFTNLASANAASRALLDQVFVDGPLGNFDTIDNGLDPWSFSAGCSTSLICYTETPYWMFFGGPVLTSTSTNSDIEVEDVIEDMVYFLSFDTNTDNSIQWARWSVAPVAAIPEPSTYAMMCLGLLGVMWMSRRRRDEV